MRIRILAIGSNMPKWVDLACHEYLNYLMSFSYVNCSIESIRTKKGLSMLEEGKLLLKKVSATDYVIALDRQGKSFSSLAYASHLSESLKEGVSWVFLIGGAEGLSQDCLDRAQLIWSLSPLTFPHAIARVLVLEQLYRSCAILSNHPYHR